MLDQSDPILRDISAAIRASNFEQAADLAEAALADGAEHPVLFNLRAFRREARGRYDEALSDLRTALRLAPGDFAAMNALGLCLTKLARMQDAMEAFDAATVLNPDFAPAHYNRGWVSEMRGDLDQALSSYERAAVLSPGDPGPPAGLASLAARRGDRQRARALAERSLQLDADHPTALLALATVEIAEDQFGAAKERLNTLLGSPRCSPVEIALATGLLGDLFDRQARPSEAFALYAACNAALRTQYVERFRGAEVETVPRMLDWLIQYFETAPMAPWTATPAPVALDGATAHVFLLGFPRSGTTLLENVLATQPDVVTIEERETLAESARDFLSSPAALDRLARADAGQLARHQQLYWTGVRRLGIDVRGKVVIDKLPLNTMKLPLIAKLFPGAKVLFALRDPRDVVLSCFRQRFRINPSMFEFLALEDAAGFYDRVMRLASLCRERLTLDTHVHRYETMVDDFDGRMRAVCDFLGLTWSQDMRDFANRANARSIATPSSSQVARGLYSEGVGQWRAYQGQLAPILPVLAPWVETFGYPAE